MTKRERFCSLNVKLLLVALCALAVCSCLFYAGRTLGNYLIANVYLREENIQRRDSRRLAEFQEFVSQNGISSKDAKQIGQWTSLQRYVYMAVYKDEYTPLFEADSEGGVTAVPEELLALYEGEDALPVQFADGVYLVTMYDYSEYFWYGIINTGAVVLACVVFVLVLLIYNRSVTGRITQLARNTARISGDLQAPIVVRGNDEITALAADVDNMRNAIIYRIRDEQAAWSANNELITSISHDIRTPLTALIGYLELLKDGQYASEEQKQMYVESSRKKAMQLKELTDELFRYFLVFGQKDIPLKLETLDAEILLEQMLGEYKLALESQGYRVLCRSLQQPCRIQVDAQYLKRVLDNLFSNVQKYADPEKAVVMTAGWEDGQLHICLSNEALHGPSQAESTNIGLKTCEKIVRQMGGRFMAKKESLRFTAEIILPAVQTQEEEPPEAAEPSR